MLAADEAWRAVLVGSRHGFPRRLLDYQVLRKGNMGNPAKQSLDGLRVARIDRWRGLCEMRKKPGRGLRVGPLWGGNREANS